MKKFYPTLFISCWLMCMQVNAQFSIRFGAGYAWPGLYNSENIQGLAVNTQTPAEDALAPLANNIDKIGGGDSIHKTKFGSYGQGANFTVGVGYMINRFFGVDLGVSYLKSADITCSQDNEFYLPNPSGGYAPTNSYIKINISNHSTQVSLSPSIIVTGDKKHWKVYPYARIGLVIPVMGRIYQNMNINTDSSNAGAQRQNLYKAPYFLGYNTQVTMQTQNEPSVGVNCALGVAYQPLPFLNIFLEINGQYLNVQAKSAQITQWDADGVNDIPARGVYRTQFTYVSQLGLTSNNSDYNTNTNTSQPKQDLRPIAPFSNIGFNMGVTFFLSKKNLHKASKADAGVKTGS